MYPADLSALHALLKESARCITLILALTTIRSALR